VETRCKRHDDPVKAMTEKSKGHFNRLAERIVTEWPTSIHIGRWIWMHIDSHVAMAIYFDGPPTKFNMTIYKSPKALCFFTETGSFSLGEIVHMECDGKYYGDIRSPEFIEILIDKIRISVIPFFTNYRSFYSMIEYFRNGIDAWHRTSWPEIRLAWCSTVEGDFNEARRQMEAAFVVVEKYKLQQQLLPTRRFQCMKHILTLFDQGADPAAIGNYLRELERETVQHYKIEKYWKPALFPFEEALGLSLPEA
jgi:hypothetical protein